MSDKKKPPKTSPNNTRGRATGKGGRRACLCEDNTYHPDCCEGYLLNQQIGDVYEN